MARGPDKLQSLRMLVRRGVPIGTVLDVGVFSGTPELCEVFPTTPHVLFEPVIEFEPAIREAYGDIPHTLVNAAVSNATGETVIGLRSMFEGVAISHSWIVDQPGYSGSVERTVPMTSIDAWVEANRPVGPYLLKIDIDGMELRVVEGAARTLGYTSVVIIEAPSPVLTERIRAVEAHGFELIDLIEPVYYDEALWQCDAVLIHREFKPLYFADINAGFDAAKWDVWKA